MATMYKLIEAISGNHVLQSILRPVFVLHNLFYFIFFFLWNAETDGGSLRALYTHENRSPKIVEIFCHMAHNSDRKKCAAFKRIVKSFGSTYSRMD